MSWPAHRTEQRPWTARDGRGPRVGPMPERVAVSIPPRIAELDFASRRTTSASEAAVIAVTHLEAGQGQYSPPLREFLLRSEAVASSRIEHIDAGWRAFSKAFGGATTRAEAESQVGAVRSLTGLVDTAATGRITEASLLSAHRVLIAPEWEKAGRLRTVQTWIGGSDYTPLNALYVPPPPELVPELMADLLAFVARGDLPILVQAAIAHAQFVSIHPFVSGNGRIGRALVSAILRRRGLTDRVTVPLASVMLADTSRYFAQLAAYRAGAADEFVLYLALAAVYASEAAIDSARTLTALPQRWRDRARPRGGSADEALLANLLEHPILTIAGANAITATTDSATYRALERLVDVGILEVVSDSKRNRIWAATDILAELDALNAAIGRRTAAGLS
ncbi:Fic family protein [Nocardia salmonicida]|uniref:Fic family protein n=1 Tax=Nocardia salmonicida TaxID=53431 RepID=UPI0007A4998D|nr:Fic family protein [Nocardia salmonicida]